MILTFAELSRRITTTLAFLLVLLLILSFMGLVSVAVNHELSMALLVVYWMAAPFIAAVKHRVAE